MSDRAPSSDDWTLAGVISADGAEDGERVRRIAEEAAAAFAGMARVRRGVTIFGSARTLPVDRWGEIACTISNRLAEAGFSVITGGGPGLMAEANRGAKEGGGESVGLTIRLKDGEPVNPFLSTHIPFHYFFLRKLALIRYSCAFVLLPGGFGTLDELFEALNLRRTHRLDPFPVILVGSEYWSGLLGWMRASSVRAGTLSEEDIDAIHVTDDPAEVVSMVVECHATLCRDLGVEP